MKDQLEKNTNKNGHLSRSSRIFLVLMGPLLLCLTGVVHVLVPPIILFSAFWLLGLAIFSFIQIFAWAFGLAWYKNGGIKAFQNSSYIKNLQNNKEHKADDLLGFITALSVAIAIVPYLIALLLIILLTIFGKLMEGGPLD